MLAFWLDWAAIIIGGWIVLACVVALAFGLVVGYGKRLEQQQQYRWAAMRALQALTHRKRPAASVTSTQVATRDLVEHDAGEQPLSRLPEH
jgi:hypothetical protein